MSQDGGVNLAGVAELFVNADRHLGLAFDGLIEDTYHLHPAGAAPDWSGDSRILAPQAHVRSNASDNSCALRTLSLLPTHHRSRLSRSSNARRNPSLVR